jgi:hypothetical protein
MAKTAINPAPGYEQRTMSGNLSGVRYSSRARQDGASVLIPHRGIAVHIPKRNAQGQLMADENGRTVTDTLWVEGYPTKAFALIDENGEVLHGAEALKAFENLSKGSKVEAEGGYTERNAPKGGIYRNLNIVRLTVRIRKVVSTPPADNDMASTTA